MSRSNGLFRRTVHASFLSVTAAIAVKRKWPRAVANNGAEVPALTVFCKTSDFAKAPQTRAAGQTSRPNCELANELLQTGHDQEKFMRRHQDCETDQFFAGPAWLAVLPPARAEPQ